MPAKKAAEYRIAAELSLTMWPAFLTVAKVKPLYWIT